MGERPFFLAAGIWFLVVSLWGFSESFYFRNGPEPLPFHLKVHGVLFTGWMVLFTVQAGLIAGGRRRAHMRLGVAGAVLVVAMIPAGFYPVLYKVSVGTKSVAHGGYNLATLTLAFAYAFAGLAMRRRPFVHKRLLFFATLTFTVAAVDRVAFHVGLENSQPFRKGLFLAPAVALFAFDLARTRRPQWFDLLPIPVFAVLYYASDPFWMSSAGGALMSALAGWI